MHLPSLSTGVASLPHLESLQVSDNQLSDVESVAELSECHKISKLDLSRNQFETSDFVLVLGRMKALHVLQLSGNPFLEQMNNYRNQILLAIEGLTYLDEYPIFPNMRKKARDWMLAGCPKDNKDRTGGKNNNNNHHNKNSNNRADVFPSCCFDTTYHQLSFSEITCGRPR